MQAIPGWMTGLIVLALVIALGWAAILPRTLTVNVVTEQQTEITNHNHAPRTAPETNPLPGE